MLKVIEQTYTLEGSPPKTLNLTMIRSWREEGDGSYSVVKRSISKGSKHSATTATFMSGCLITPIRHGSETDAKSTFLLWFAQLDRETVCFSLFPIVT